MNKKCHTCFYRAKTPRTAAAIAMTPATLDEGMTAAFPVSVLVEAVEVEFPALELGEAVLVIETTGEEVGAGVTIVLPW
jgi:hypothetical protein